MVECGEGPEPDMVLRAQSEQARRLAPKVYPGTQNMGTYPTEEVPRQLVDARAAAVTVPEPRRRWYSFGH